jgi:hypothetical protein
MTTILIKKKDTAGAPAPGDLTNAAGGTEIAVNTATKRIYTKDSGGNVVELGTNSTSSTIDQLTVVTSTTLSYGTANQVQYLNASKLLVGSSNMTFNGTTLTVNDLTDSSLTAGRVTYAGTSGNLVDSANLAFDGTNLGLGGTTNSYGSQTTLTLSGSNVSRIDFRSNSVLTGTILSYQSITEGLRLSTVAGYPITFHPAATEAGRFTAAGNLLIATTSATSAPAPSGGYLLEVAKNQNAFTEVLVKNTDVNSAGQANYVAISDTVTTRFGSAGSGDAYQTSSSGFVSVDGAYPLTFRTNSTERGRFDSSGNFMVGTSTIGAGNRMKVVGNNVVFTPNTATYNTHTFSTGTADIGSYAIANLATTTVFLNAGGTSYFNGGNVAIGATSSTVPLSVTAATATISVKSTGIGSNAVVAIDNTGTDVASLFRTDINGTTTGYIGAGGATYPNLGGNNSLFLWNVANGPLVFATNNTERGRFTGSQFLVGTTTTSGGEIARFQTASGTTNIGIIAATNGGSYVNFGDTSDANVGYIGYDHTSNYMAFRTNGAEAMRISSAGYVTEPYQPCFSARQTSTGLTTSTNAEQKFDVVIFNTGSHYNASTGRFTAPVAGKYLFRFQMLTDNTSGRALCYLALNNNNSLPTVEASSTTANYNDIHAMAIFDLAAGDFVSIKNSTAAESLFYGSPSNQNWFIGYLIG